MAMSLAVRAVAIVLAASSAAQAAARSGYESEPVLKAADLAGAEVLRGPHFTVDPKVPIQGFIARFTIRSSFGTFEAHGLRMLPIRVNEVEALAKLDEVSKTREFVAAAGRAAVRPVTAAVSMARRPVQTVTGIPGGAARLFGRIGLAGTRVTQAATAPGQSGVERTAETSRRVGQATITALGFEQERRGLAERLGVDPYTTNAVLSERLTDVAWVAFSGRFVISAATAILVPYSAAMAGVSVTNRAIWDTPAADLVNNARAVFGGTEASSDQVRALMENPYYSLSVLTALATGITRLQGVTGRDAVVVFAAAAQSEDEANFVTSAVNMLARYHESVAPLARLSAPGPLLGHTASGALVLPAPVDYVSWIEALGRDVARPELQAAEKVAFVSGQVSPLAHKQLTARGWTILETYTTAAER
jgi:hypothetical protein